MMVMMVMMMMMMMMMMMKLLLHNKKQNSSNNNNNPHSDPRQPCASCHHVLSACMPLTQKFRNAECHLHLKATTQHRSNPKFYDNKIRVATACFSMTSSSTCSNKLRHETTKLYFCMGDWRLCYSTVTDSNDNETVTMSFELKHGPHAMKCTCH
eukprot:6373049-Amphidinium_carterae.1